MVEISNWRGKGRFSVETAYSEDEAAVLHDLAKLYVDPKCNKLNVEILERKLQQVDPALACPGAPLWQGGKEFLLNHVRAIPPEADVKEWIVAQAPVALELLKAEISRERSRAGRQRKELEEIDCFPVVRGSEPEECTDWNAFCEKKDALIASQQASITVAQNGWKDVMAVNKELLGFIDVLIRSLQDKGMVRNIIIPDDIVWLMSRGENASIFDI